MSIGDAISDSFSPHPLSEIGADCPASSATRGDSQLPRGDKSLLPKRQLPRTENWTEPEAQVNKPHPDHWVYDGRNAGTTLVAQNGQKAFE